MNTSNSSGNQEEKGGKLGITTGIATLGVAGGLSALNPNAAGMVASWTGDKVLDILEGTGEFLNNGAETLIEAAGNGIPFASAAAPFVGPVIAGGILGKKIADIAKIEGMGKKIAATVTGAVAGGIAASALAPVVASYLTGAATVAALYPVAKFGIKGIGRLGAAGYGAGAGMFKGAVLGAINGGINNFSEQKINPSINRKQRTTSS